MLMITQSLAMTQAFILGMLVVTGRVELWHVYVLALCLGTINALDGPVRQAFAVELVGREQLVNAVALNSSIFNTARIVGPAVAGVAIAALGLSWAFMLNAASFIAVLGAYAVMHPAEFYASNRRAAAGNVLGQIAEGIRYSVRTPIVLFYFILLAFIGTFGYNFTVVIPLVAEFILHVGPQRFGLLTSSMGLGSLAAALILATVGRLSLRTLLVACSLFAAIFAGVALSEWYWVTAGLLVLLGMASIVFTTTINTSLQIIVPDELRGRVMSIYFLLFAGSTPLGGYLTGLLAEYVGVPEALVIEALLCALGISAALAFRWLRADGFGTLIEVPASPESRPRKAAYP
jgi:MFS family permease